MAFEDVYIYSDDPDKFLDEVQIYGTEEDKKLFNPQTGYDREVLKQHLLNGINNGSKTFANWQRDNNIRIPQTDEEVADARAGRFNQLSNALGNSALTANVQAQPNNWARFAMGYRDNYDNGFSPDNFRKDPNKNWAYRVGEGLGTVGRFIDSPIGRGILAAGLNSALGYDNSAREGLTALIGRQNAITADKLYRRQLKDYGYSDEDLANIRGNITSDMYKNLANNAYKIRNLDQNTYIKLKKAYDDQLRMGILSPEQYQANVEALNQQYINSQVQTMQAGNVQESNQTRNTDSQIAYREQRLLQINKQLEQNEQKIAILRQRVANGMASEGQKAQLRALTIQQKQLENQILNEYIGNNGNNGGEPPRPVGQQANTKTGTTKNGTKYRVID